jgi:hypothetical protein
MPRRQPRIWLYSDDGRRLAITRPVAEKLAASPRHKDYRDKDGQITHIVACRAAQGVAKSRQLHFVERLAGHAVYSLRFPDGRTVA